MSKHDRVVAPRNGHTFVVGIVARISGCANQKEVSLDDQVEHAEEELKLHGYIDPMERITIKTVGKGERLDRPELAEVETHLRSRRLDVLVMEDIGRLVRGAAAVDLFGIGVDNGTRILSPNDCIDSWDEGWESDVLTACAENVGHNEHTSKRIKHKSMVRFLRNGGCPGRPIYGYIVADGARTYSEWQIDLAATPVINEMYRRLLDGQSYGTIADHLTAEQIPLGPYARRKAWDGKMVRRILLNPILCGKPQRGKMRTIKVHETGRRVSKKNPDGPRSIEMPHLAHVSPELFERARQVVADRAARYRRKPVNGEDPLTRVPRKDSRFPGRCARCWYCGRQYVWGGNGIAEHLQCNGSREWHCWNSVGIDGQLVVSRVRKVISDLLYSLDGVAEHFSDLVEEATRNLGTTKDGRLQKLQVREAKLEREKNNLAAVIRDCGSTDLTKQLVQQLQQDEMEVRRERAAVAGIADMHLRPPRNVLELRELFDSSLMSLATNSVDFAHQLRKVIPRFDVFLVRFIDSNRIVPRACITVALDGIDPGIASIPGLPALLRRDVTLNLFEPPQRERIRTAVVALNDGIRTHKQIAELIPEKPTATAVQRALALQRQMQMMQMADPFELLLNAPEGTTRLRRQCHSRYEFTMLEGYHREPIN